MTDFIGAKRLPMVIIDSKSVLKDPKQFSARGAGIIGMMTYGYDHFYALDDKMQLDIEALREYLAKHKGERIFFFGFTFMVWLHFCQVVQEQKLQLDMEDAVLVHSGGWKKLQEMSVSNDAFREVFQAVTGSNKVYNFYGMVEQTGSVYMECEQGHFHASNFSQIIIRDPLTHQVMPFGKVGLIETLSALPTSYPGHALLTEDLGKILGEDDCPCGRKGRYFSFHGRLPKAEVRGCSDTYADNK